MYSPAAANDLNTHSKEEIITEIKRLKYGKAPGVETLLSFKESWDKKI